MIEEITNGLIAATNNSLEKIIADAFRRHFGYDIQFADKEELQHLITEGEELQSFQYCHETFLYISGWETKYEFDSVGAKVKVLMKMKYKMV